jgi:hypothetical protein
MKKITIYSLEGCSVCNNVAEKIQELIAGKDITFTKNYCGANDTECDTIEDTLGSSKYPIVFLFNFPYYKEKYNKVNGIVYICNESTDLHTPVKFSADTVGEGVLDKVSLINKLTQII